MDLAYESHLAAQLEAAHKRDLHHFETQLAAVKSQLEVETEEAVSSAKKQYEHKVQG